ncbi:unnamed protein product [Peniophora sp. CBMAI 1063]|nr:unnamed protein product [Peniophora sp. CBMAI 1063]
MITYSCAICLNDWPHTEMMRSLTCGHTFCEACINQHLNLSRPLCPTCRAGPVKQHHIRPVFISADMRDAPPVIASPARDRAGGVPIELLPKLHQITLDLLSLTPGSNIDPGDVSDSILDLLASQQCNEAVKTVLIGTFTNFLESNVAPAYEVLRDIDAQEAAEAAERTAKKGRRERLRTASSISQSQATLNAVAQAQIQALIKENNQLRQENIALLLDRDPA